MGTISIIGTGNMAQAIAGRAIAGGNSIEIMGRDEAKAEALVKTLGRGAATGQWGSAPTGDIVIAALLADGVVPALAHYGEALAGKVIVDISNPFNATFDGLAHAQGQSVAQQAAKVVPASASVVKAFNTVFRQVLEHRKPDVFLAGDDEGAKAQVKGLIASMGMQPLDVGGLAMAHWLEGAGLLTVGLANHGMGWNVALGAANAAA